MNSTIIISTQQYEEMLEHIRQQIPEEACGIIAGKVGKATRIHPITNELRSTSKFRMHSIELLHVLESIDQSEDELIGIFHSHPTGPDHPSQTDINEAYYPDASHLIWSLKNKKWVCMAYEIREGDFSEIELIVSD